jgi:hypothetical protein
LGSRLHPWVVTCVGVGMSRTGHTLTLTFTLLFLSPSVLLSADPTAKQTTPSTKHTQPHPRPSCGAASHLSIYTPVCPSSPGQIRKRMQQCLSAVASKCSSSATLTIECRCRRLSSMPCPALSCPAPSTPATQPRGACPPLSHTPLLSLHAVAAQCRRAPRETRNTRAALK